MNDSPSDRCGYTWPEDHEIDDTPDNQSCCWREPASDDVDRCIWHADFGEDEKSIEALEDARAPSKVRNQNSPYAEILDGANLPGVIIGITKSFENVALREGALSGVDFRAANLSGSDLKATDLSGADLENSDLSGVYLTHADLSDASFWGANFSDAHLRGVDFSGADLRFVDFSGADLRYSNLSNSDLRGANLSYAHLREADITDPSVDAETKCERLYEGYWADNPPTRLSILTRLGRPFRGSYFISPDWDATARAYHDLKTVFSDHGLVGKARDMHVRERRARSLEAKAANGWTDRTYLGSLPSRIFTGYGVGVRNLLIWMVALFVVSTAVYVDAGVRESLVDNVGYSVLAFTVAPPGMPSSLLAQVVMMIETFFGTLSIVLLGYILGNREQF